MTQPRNVLVLGGGAAGNAVTVLLRRAGVHVDLVEAKQDWNATTGSGITVQGNALRVLRELGVWDRVRTSGYPFDGVGITAPDGTVLHVQDDIRTGGPDLPATVGMQRPQLQQILIDAVRESGAHVHLGVTAETLDSGADGVGVRFSDGTERHYDLVIGADGVNSRTRALIGVPERPEPTGMAIWRAPLPRPASVVRTDLAYGGPAFIAGYCPTSADTVYAYLVEASRDRGSIPPQTYPAEMRRLARHYGGAWLELAPHITDQTPVNYTCFEQLLVEGSWHRGRVVLIGDAVHACPPTMAQGAAMALEDAWVLAELLTSREEWDEQLLQDFHDRRIARVRSVVQASVQIGRWQLDGVPDADIPGVFGRVMTMLKEVP